MSVLLAACLVIAMHDGDTLQVRCQKRAHDLVVRVAEVDSPEYRAFTWGDQPGRVAGLDEAKRTCPIGGPAKVRLNKFDGRTRRWIAHVECNGVDLSSRLAATGVAWPYIVDKKSAIPALVKAAQDQRIGLWSGTAVPVAPTVWRKAGMHQPPGVNLP